MIAFWTDQSLKLCVIVKNQVNIALIQCDPGLVDGGIQRAFTIQG